MNTYIKDIANYLCIELLNRGFHILRYDAHTTSSVYIKLDYGVCNSIRISDHKGKKWLHYRYNLITTIDGVYREQQKGLDRIYYGPNQIKHLLNDIMNSKQDKLNRYFAYNALMSKVAEERKNDKGFWQSAYEVYLDAEGKLKSRKK